MNIGTEMLPFLIRINYQIHVEKHIMVTQNQRHINAQVLAYDVVRCQQFNIIFTWCVLSFGVSLFVTLKKDTRSACGCCCNVLTPISFLWRCLRMRNISPEMEM
jgi:hypothetical protein